MKIANTSPSPTLASFDYFKNMEINCGRTIKRFIRTMTTLAKQPGRSIAAASADAAEAKAIYRLLQNPKLTEERILTSYRKETITSLKASGESIILCVQDTTEMNYSTLAQTQGLGEGNPWTKGLQAHSCLALTPSGVPLGLLHQHIWARDPNQRGKRKVNRPFEEKESYKWAACAKASVEGLPENVRPIHIGDREADLFELFFTLEAWEQAYLIRAVQNRTTDADGQLLLDRVKEQPACVTVRTSIPRDTRRGLKARETSLEIRFLSCGIQVTEHLRKKLGNKQSLPCTIIYAKEVTPPEEGEAIEWFLLTNLPVHTPEEAVEKVRWYVQRWKIERFHYILKSGCEAEKLQEREADRLKKLILMYSIISVELLHVTYLARDTPDAPCTIVFEEHQWQVLYRIANQTTSLPKAPPTLEEAVRALAKLGGFLGRKSDGDPGVKVLWRGYRTLYTVLETYRFLL